MQLFTLSPVNIYLFKVNNRNIIKRCKICLKLAVKTYERRQQRRLGVFIVNFQHIVSIVSINESEQVNVSWVMCFNACTHSPSHFLFLTKEELGEQHITSII